VVICDRPAVVSKGLLLTARRCVARDESRSVEFDEDEDKDEDENEDEDEKEGRKEGLPKKNE
jgi:hypothetical protein